MRLTILGTRGEIEESTPYHAKKSGLLIDKTLMLDLGEKTFLDFQPKWIYITHLHPDHAYFVRKGKEEFPATKAHIHAPEKQGFPIGVVKRKQKVGSYTIFAIPTIHSKSVLSCAYLVEKGKKRILYTGDMIWIEKKYHSLFSRLDLVITEASFLKEGGMIRRDKDRGQIYGHTGLPNLIRLFQAYTDRLLFLHFGSWFYQDMQKKKKKIKQLGKEYGIEAISAYDGMEITV